MKMYPALILFSKKAEFLQSYLVYIQIVDDKSYFSSTLQSFKIYRGGSFLYLQIRFGEQISIAC